MNESHDTSLISAAPSPLRRPVLTVIALLFIPIAYWLCCGVVRERAVPDFLGFDIGRAVFRSHFPASIIALGFIVAAFIRHERPRIVVVLLGIVAGAWFAFSTYFTLHAFPFLP